MKRIALGAAFGVALVLSTPASAAEDTGARLYFNHCAACHGDDAEGTGPVAASMRVTVPNLRTLAQRNGGVFPVEAVTAYVDGRDMKAAHGDRQMPVWGDVFRTGDAAGAADRAARERVAAVVKFLEVIQEPLPRVE